MKQTRTRFAPAALLLAAAALPSPLAAQEAQPAPPPAAAQQPAAPPVVDVPAPPAPSAPAPAAAAEPAASAPPASAPTAAATAVRTAAPLRTAAPVRIARPAPVLRSVPVVPAAPATTTTTVTTSPPAAVALTPPPAALPTTTAPEPIAAAPSTGVDTVAPAPKQAQPQLSQRTAVWPWFLLGAILIAAAALLLLRRRRPAIVHEETYAPEPAPVAVVPAAAVMAEPVAPAEPAGAPDLALSMRPVRAGVAGGNARVEFELTVGNRGTAPARDVRVKTWMLAAGASEAERALIEPAAGAATPPVDIAAGEARTLEAQVALARAEIPGDAVLPVVVADARYLLPDGTEAHAIARFAVGVPDGEELAHFATDNPSGLHEGVVAQTLGEPETV